MMNRSRFGRIITSFTFICLLTLIITLSSGYAEDLPRFDESTDDTDVYLPLVTNPLTLIIPETTKVLTEQTTQYLGSVSEDGIVFTYSQTTPELDALEVGDVMVADVSAAAPYGFLRRVLNVTRSGGQVVVTTGDATLEDAIEQGSFQLSVQLTPDDIQSATFAEGVSPASSRTANMNDSFFLTIDKTIKDGIAQAKVKGSVEFSPEFDLTGAIEGGAIQNLRFDVKLNETAILDLTLEASGSFSKEIEIAKYDLGTRVILLSGWFPIVVGVELPVYVGANGEFRAGVTTTVTQNATASAGAHYANGAWSSSSSLKPKFDFGKPKPILDARVKGYVGARLQLTVYFIPIASAAAQPYLLLKGNINETPWWTLTGGFEVILEMKIKILGYSLVDYSDTVIDNKKILAQAYVPNDPLPIDGGTSPTESVDLRWAGPDPSADPATYAIGSAIYDVYIEAADATPDVKVSSGQATITYHYQPPGGLDPEKEYYWKIVAQDASTVEAEGPVWTFTPRACRLRVSSPDFWVSSYAYANDIRTSDGPDVVEDTKHSNDIVDETLSTSASANSGNVHTNASASGSIQYLTVNSANGNTFVEGAQLTYSTDWNYSNTSTWPNMSLDARGGYSVGLRPESDGVIEIRYSASSSGDFVSEGSIGWLLYRPWQYDRVPINGSGAVTKTVKAGNFYTMRFSSVGPNSPVGAQYDSFSGSANTTFEWSFEPQKTCGNLPGEEVKEAFNVPPEGNELRFVADHPHS